MALFNWHPDIHHDPKIEADKWNSQIINFMDIPAFYFFDMMVSEKKAY